MNRREDFLQAVCSKIKYQGIHKDVRDELTSHIEEIANVYREAGYSDDKATEFAVSAMGSAEEIGKGFDQQHKMPFNSKYGLFLWSLTATATIHFAIFPLISAIYNSGLVLVMFTAFGIINNLILKRGRFKVCGNDIKQITFGFFAGMIASLAVLYLWSATAKIGYYPYCDDVEILFFKTVGGSAEFPFGLGEIVMWCICVGLYFVSVPIKSTEGFYFAKALNGTLNTSFIRADKDDFNYMSRTKNNRE